jgi:hypothetical protein
MRQADPDFGVPIMALADRMFARHKPNIADCYWASRISPCAMVKRRRIGLAQTAGDRFDDLTSASGVWLPPSTARVEELSCRGKTTCISSCNHLLALCHMR